MISLANVNLNKSFDHRHVYSVAYIKDYSLLRKASWFPFCLTLHFHVYITGECVTLQHIWIRELLLSTLAHNMKGTGYQKAHWMLAIPFLMQLWEVKGQWQYSGEGKNCWSHFSTRNTVMHCPPSIPQNLTIQETSRDKFNINKTIV